MWLSPESLMQLKEDDWETPQLHIDWPEFSRQIAI